MIGILGNWLGNPAFAIAALVTEFAFSPRPIPASTAVEPARVVVIVTVTLDVAIVVLKSPRFAFKGVT